MLSRRSILLSAAGATLAGCNSRTKNAFVGYVFVAARDSGDIAIVDLAAFSLMKKRIQPAGRPMQLLDVPGEDSLISVTEEGIIEEIEVSSASIRRRAKTQLAGGSAWLSADAKLIWGLSEDRRRLLAIQRQNFTVLNQWKLPSAGNGIAVSPETQQVAVSLPEGVAILIRPDLQSLVHSQLGPFSGQIRFLKNGSKLLIAQEAERQLTLVDGFTGKVVVKLPLPIRPDNLCFNADGGQLYITGEGLDGVVVVYPFQSQVASTMLSGKDPGPMAVSSQPQFLFVTSPSTGTVSVLDVRTQKLAAVVGVGADPRTIVVTPDNSMALVLNQGSGDLAIIRLANIVSKRNKTAPLFTMIPVGSAPIAAVVRSFPG